MPVKKSRILLVPLDPVHDVALKILNRKLKSRGHETILLPPDLPMEEVISRGVEADPDVIMVSRTLGYGVGELLGKFIDMAEAAGLREKARIVIGGKAIKPELAAELGFDKGFGSETDLGEAVAYVEQVEFVPEAAKEARKKPDITAGYGYTVKAARIGALLDEISSEIVAWTDGKTSPGVQRGRLRERMIETAETGAPGPKRDALIAGMKNDYLGFCDEAIVQSYREGILPKHVRRLDEKELASLEELIGAARANPGIRTIRHTQARPLVFVQYGTGCLVMDVAHIKASEAWGADGVFHFDPSWGARTEGFLEGCLSHQQDGSIITEDNLRTIKRSLSSSTLWTVRGHRGLNTPETVALAGRLGADLTKINIAYGSLTGGTDPARLTVDGVECIRMAAKYRMPFDIVTNEELAGVPAHKAFAGMLIVAALSLKLGARPILKPLFCYSPEVMIGGRMDDNYVDFNAAKVWALRGIIDAPIWPGEPIGFMTHFEDRVQSAATTAFHAALGISLGVDAITVASADEAYSRGPISVASRVDTLRAVKEAFRFFGAAQIAPTSRAREWADELAKGIERTLESVARRGSFVQSLYEGLLGSPEDGAYPGRAGKGTVIQEA